MDTNPSLMVRWCKYKVIDSIIYVLSLSLRVYFCASFIASRISV